MEYKITNKVEQTFTGLIDGQDAHLLEDYNYSVQIQANNVYVIRSFTREDGARRSTHIHRDIMKPAEGEQVDHLNGNGMDNRRENLEIVSNRENTLRGQSTRSASGLIGVTVCQGNPSKPFRGQAYDAQGAYRHIGLFDTRLKAALEYDAYVGIRDGHDGNTNAVRNSELMLRLIAESLAGVVDDFDPSTATRPAKPASVIEKLGLEHVADKQRELKRIAQNRRRAKARLNKA
tara:strand:+ start:243 stop:941 length:699 start_codon:yes stop_codon:yes gene_type:complete